jgi:drug/metabolite transporter (DMT)-like permease
LGAALAAAVCYGVASVLQAVGARRTPTAENVDPAVLMRTLRQVPFLAGLALDGLGFLAQYWALRTVPIFVVQAALAGSLAVTAVVAVPVLHARLGRTQWAAVAAVCLGLGLLGLSAGAESTAAVPLGFRLALLACVAILAAVGVAVNRLPDAVRAVGLGLVAGLGFGVVALAARATEGSALLRDPATYAVVAGGVVAFLYYTIGLQRAAVTTVTAALVIGETVLPSVVGVVALGDTTRPGYLPVALVGFVLAVAGSLALARFGDPT